MGEPIYNVSEEPSEQPDGLAFFVFDATIGLVQTDNRPADINPFSIRFALPLPQHDRSNNSTETHPDDMSGDTPPTFLTIGC
jgi:hypothetical protein